MQPAGGALEFEAAVAGDVEIVRLGRRRHDQLGLRFIERIDQRDETRRLVAAVRRKLLRVVDQQGVVVAREGEIST